MEESVRRNEIEVAMSFIQSMCEQTKIGLIPYQREDGTLMVLIEDATNGKRYAITSKGDK